VAAAAIAAAAVLAACGSNSPSTSSSSGHPTQVQIQDQRDAIRFVQCLRSHGVTNVPDPTASSGRGFKDAMSSALQTPAGQSAYTACHQLLPGGGPHSQSAAHAPAQIAAFLAFARCIRSHGFPTFPDPTSSGELTHEMLANAGINLHQPAVLRAGDACVGVTHGTITKAAVARFVAGQ
jgi:hypothetical protein